MIERPQLIFAGAQHALLRDHLIATDGKEAAAILLCRSAWPACARLMVIDMLLVPHALCSSRESDFISWPGEMLSAAINRAEDEGLSLILIHSHPGGYFGFSVTDDASDHIAIGSIFQGWDGPEPFYGHGSAIMVPSGQICARLYEKNLDSTPVDTIWVIGDDIRRWRDGEPAGHGPMAFGSSMTSLLGELHAAVIGVSGTGSIIAEQAARMGFGKLTLIDFDRIEEKNLNRILGSSGADAREARLKVESFAAHALSYRPDLEIVVLAQNIFSREAVLAAAKSDVLFCCVDSAEGRQIVDLIAQAFMLPMIDMGVTIPTRRRPDSGLAVAEVVGRIDYIQPLGSTLFDRGVYSAASLRAEYLARVEPDTFYAEIAEGYIKGAPQEAPSVIALNMRAASAAMVEFLARMFPFRHESNRLKARTIFMLADGDQDYCSEDDFARTGAHDMGRGVAEPLLGLPALG